jgi:hypothetical protein
MWNRPTRRSVVASVMSANEGQPMEAVLPLIVEAIHSENLEKDGFGIKEATRAYRSAVRNGRAPGESYADSKAKAAEPEIEVA